jgi:LPS export ABC transporter protein LptC
MIKRFYVFALLGLLSASISACQENDFERVKRVAQGNLAEKQVGKDVEIIYSDSGTVKTRILAPVVIKSEGNSPTTTMPNGVRAFFLGPDLKPKSSLKADKAIRKERERTIECTGHVVVVSVEGDTLLTERLVWEEHRERLYSDKFVTIKTPKETLYGTGFESNQTFTKYSITNIQGIIAAPSK